MNSRQLTLSLLIFIGAAHAGFSFRLPSLQQPQRVPAPAKQRSLVQTPTETRTTAVRVPTIPSMPKLPSHLVLPVFSYTGLAAVIAGAIKLIGASSWMTWALVGYTVVVPMGLVVMMCSRGGSGVAKAMGGVPADAKLLKYAREAAEAVGVPPPEAVYVVKAKEPNAFASSSIWSAEPTVAITSGLQDLLSTNELKAVLAHEMGHLKHCDVMRNMHVAIAAAGFAGIYDAGRAMLDSSQRSSKRKKDKDKGSDGTSLALVLMGTGLATQLVANIVKLAASRNAELRADFAAAEAFGADSMVSALQKINSASAQTQQDLSTSKAGRAFAFAMISNGHSEESGSQVTTSSRNGPWNMFKRATASVARVFSTHPSVQTRIGALECAVADGKLRRK